MALTLTTFLLLRPIQLEIDPRETRLWSVPAVLPRPAEHQPGSRLEEISERTGIPLKLLRTLQEKNGELVLQGASLGYINAQGEFKALISAGDGT